MTFPRTFLFLSRNALDDLATFITWYKQQKNAQSSPVITYGGSYSGALSGEQ